MIIKGKQCLIFFFVKFSYSSNLLVDCCRLLLLHKRLPLCLYTPRGKIQFTRSIVGDIVCMSFMCEHKFLWQIRCPDDIACKNSLASWHGSSSK